MEFKLLVVIILQAKVGKSRSSFRTVSWYLVRLTDRTVVRLCIPLLVQPLAESSNGTARQRPRIRNTKADSVRSDIEPSDVVRKNAFILSSCLLCAIYLEPNVSLNWEYSLYRPFIGILIFRAPIIPTIKAPGTISTIPRLIPNSTPEVGRKRKVFLSPVMSKGLKNDNAKSPRFLNLRIS